MNKTVRSLLILPIFLGLLFVFAALLGLVDLLAGGEDTRPSVGSIIKNIVLGLAIVLGSVYLRKQNPK